MNPPYIKPVDIEIKLYETGMVSIKHAFLTYGKSNDICSDILDMVN
jgi:hypothetical protein